MPCLHISTHFMAWFLIISWKKRLHSGETLKRLSLHVNIKRDSEKWGGEHQGHRWCPQDIPSRMKRTSRTQNYDPEKSHRHSCWKVRKKHEYRKRVVLEHDSVNLRRVDNEILGRTGRQEMMRALWVRRKYTEHTHIQRGEDDMTSQWKDSSSFRSLHFFCVLNYSVNGVLSTVCLTGWQETQQEGDIQLCSKKKKKRNTLGWTWDQDFCRADWA